MSQEQEKIESLSQQLTAADKRVVALERENERLRRLMGELAAAARPKRGSQLPGSADAIREAVRLIGGHLPEWLPDSEQWSFTEFDDSELRQAALTLTCWLDDHAPQEATNG